MDDLISRQALKEVVFDHCVSMSVCISAEERAGMIRMRDAILEDIDNAQAVAYIRGGENMKFKLGQLMQTAGIAAMISESKEFGQFVAASLRRYTACDWGEMSKEDFECNDEALENGDRIFAAYVDKDDTKIWIITEADRSYTTVLFPDEY